MTSRVPQVSRFSADELTEKAAIAGGLRVSQKDEVRSRWHF